MYILEIKRKKKGFFLKKMGLHKIPFLRCPHQYAGQKKILACHSLLWAFLFPSFPPHNWCENLCVTFS